MELENKIENNVPNASASGNKSIRNVQTQNTESADGTKDKMSKKQIIGLVVLSLIALGGVLFGVFGMTSQNEQIAQLKAQAEEAQEKVAKLETEKVTITDPDGTTIADDTTNAINTTDYIYVGEWGLKIKIPEGLSTIGYKFSEGSYGEYLTIAGAKTENSDNLFKYTDADKFFAGSLVKSNSEDGFYPYGTLVYTDGEQNKYYYEGPQVDMGLTEEETSAWRAGSNLIKEMLNNSENYSRI